MEISRLVSRALLAEAIKRLSTRANIVTIDAIPNFTTCFRPVLKLILGQCAAPKHGQEPATVDQREQPNRSLVAPRFAAIRFALSPLKATPREYRPGRAKSFLWPGDTPILVTQF
jgi:hypothetical protein